MRNHKRTQQSIRMGRFNVIAQTLNAALGSGKFNDIGYQQVVDEIDAGTILEFLEHRLDAMVPFSILQPIDRLELLMEWESMICCVEPLAYNGHRNGLCLLVGYILQGLAWRGTDPRYGLVDGIDALPRDHCTPTGDDENSVPEIT